MKPLGTLGTRGVTRIAEFSVSLVLHVVHPSNDLYSRPSTFDVRHCLLPSAFCVLLSLTLLLSLTPVLPLYGQRSRPQVRGSDKASQLAESTRALYKGDHQKAASLAQNFLKIHPLSSEARVLLARAEIAQGRYQSAYQELGKALRSDPNNIDLLYYLGIVCGILSQAEYQKLYAMAPDSARIHQLLAESYQAQEKAAEAEEEYEAALKADPRSVEVLVALADMKRTQSRFDEAMVYYLRANEIDLRDYDSIYGLGVCHYYRQDNKRAIEFFRRAIALDPHSAPARLALGSSLVRVGEWADAATELKSAAALEPKMRQTYYLLGRVYQRLGQTEAAKEAFRRFDELAKSDTESARSVLTSDDLILTQPARSKGVVRPLR